MGINARILRRADVKSSGGTLSERFDALCITNVPGPFSPDDTHPAAVIIRKETGDIILVPQEILESGRWFTAGGNYAYASDETFTDALEELTGYPYAFPISICDWTD